MNTPKSKSSAIRNHILAALPPAQLELVLARAELRTFNPKASLLLPDRPVENVYFPESGSVSMIALMTDGSRAEVGLIGNEGFIGVPIILGSASSPLEAMVQVEGGGYVIAAAAFQRLLEEAPALLPSLLKYIGIFHMQVAQTAACNSRHQIEQRLARWLLMTHDRAHNDSFLMTHDFLSMMLGVRRPSITVALGALTRAGIVKLSAGHLTVTNRAGLEAAACECYRQVQDRVEAAV